MRNSLKKAAALAFAIMMLLTLIPAGLATEDGVTPETKTSEWVVPGISDGGALMNSLNATAANDATATYTVQFNIGDEATAAGVSKPADVQVEAGKTLSELPVVKWQDTTGEAVKIFAGWYTDANLTTEFDRDSLIRQDVTLFAKWVEPNDPDRYYVNFYSQDGMTVLLTVSVENGKTVYPATASALEGKIFRGWSVEMQNEQPLSEMNAFNFDQAVSDAVSEGNTLNLYAWYGDEVSVSFVTNGGSSVATQYIAQGEKAVEPVTTRTGFTFRGWSSDSANYTAFDFKTPITENITLYGFWDAQMVPVTLVYMYENPDDDDYSPAGVSQTVYAPAGSYLSIEKNSNITNLNGTHNVRYSNTAGGTLNGYARTAQTGGRNANIPDVSETYFQYDSATNNRYVMPDGTTVVLVYYKRVRVTLTFNYKLDSDASIDVNSHVSAEDQAKYSVNYTETTRSNYFSSYKNFTYSFTAKYGERISAVWPQVGWVSTKGNFYGWQKPNSRVVQVSNVYTLVNDLFNSPTVSNGTLTATGTLPAVEQDTNVYWLIYARTTLPGEKVDFTYNGSSYTVYSEACQMAKASQYFGYKALDGCTPVSGEPEFGQRYRDLNNMSKIAAASGTMQEKFQSVFGQDAIANSDYCQVLLYDRSSINLSLFAYDDTYGSTPQTASYLYGEWIYNEDTDLLKQVEAAMSKEHYRFAGWYTDASFTPGTEYVPDAESRIYANMNLYAKWEPSQFLAEYYLYTDDSVPYATQGFAEGGRIDDKLVPTAVQSQFVGWYWYRNGKLERFDFSSTVGSAHVDGEGKLKLYAVWQGTTGKVSYLPGIGGDNATQEQYDSRDFEINAASVEMPSYKSVWSSGVPTDDTLTFVGWKAPNGAIYQPGRYVLVTRTLMQFEAQWSKDSVKLIYNANGGDGSDVTETWGRNSNVAIWDNMDANTPHFTRANYELIGWDENKDASTPTYRLGQGTITLTKDTTTLYAIWKPCVTDVTVCKQVTGNFGDKEKNFTFRVEVNGYTLVLVKENEEYRVAADGSGADSLPVQMKHGGSFTIKDIPIGAALTVTESDGTGYQTSYTIGEKTENGNKAEYTVPENGGEILFTNHKEAHPDTGVLLDSLPYILIIACVAAIGAFIVIRRRKSRED